MFISLDHFDGELHNIFRGFKPSFAWVKEGTKNAIAADLVVTLSICPTKSFVTEENMMKYAELAKKMGVSFIQVLEPKAVGHYRGKDVKLAIEHEKVLEVFMLKLNYGKAYRDYPIVSYHGFYQRRAGCFGAGEKSLYIDTDGDIHACPFCHTKMGNALDPDIDESIAQLRSAGCHSFKKFSIG